MKTILNKTGIYSIILGIILFISGNIIWILYPDISITTYSDKKFMHISTVLDFISPFIALFGLSFIFYNKELMNNKCLKYLTIICIILTVISIITVILACYYMFSSSNIKSLIYGVVFLFISSGSYFIYLIYIYYLSYKSRIKIEVKNEQ